MSKAKQKPKYLNKDEVSVKKHLSIQGHPLSLDQINSIDEKANKHPDGFRAGMYAARKEFAEKHTFKKGLWRVK